MVNYGKAISFLALVMGAVSGDKVKGLRKEKRNLMGGAFNGMHEDTSSRSAKKGGAKKGSPEVGTADAAPSSLTLTLTNLHAFHHFGLWFVAVHEPGALEVFKPNVPASAGLGTLCMTGDASGLVAEAENLPGVTHVAQELAILQTPAFEAIGSLPGTSPAGIGLANGSLDLSVPLASANSVVTVVAMIANSNDGCVILNAKKLRPGMTVPFVEIDVGTEGNDEACENIGGCGAGVFGDAAVDTALSEPENKLCPCPLNTGNTGTPIAGEGFMSYHRGVTTLPGNDWRDHMVWATVA